MRSRRSSSLAAPPRPAQSQPAPAPSLAPSHHEDLVPSDSGGDLPFLDQLEALFGGHDLSDVRAHTGASAEDAASDAGALAFAAGEDVVLGGRSDLFAVAHEATHVVQQRAGQGPPGGQSRPGDPWEEQADAVAERVVRGQSADDLLDPLGAPRGPSSTARAVQRIADPEDDGGRQEAIADLLPGLQVQERALTAVHEAMIRLREEALELAETLPDASGEAAELERETERVQGELLKLRETIDRLADTTIDPPDATEVDALLAKHGAGQSTELASFERELEAHKERGERLKKEGLTLITGGAVDMGERVDSKSTSYDAETQQAKSTAESKSTTFGLVDGLQHKRSSSEQIVRPDGTVSTATTSHDKVDWSGLSTSTTQTREGGDLPGGAKKHETKDSASIGWDGSASATTSDNRTYADDSTHEKSTSLKGKAGDGKGSASASHTDERKDKDGNSQKLSATGEATAALGDDSVALGGKGGLSVEDKNKDGTYNGASLNVSGNVSSKVTEISGSDPPRYRVTVTVSLGGSVSFSDGKAGKENKGGVSVSASGSETMTFGREVSGAEVQGYLDQVERARNGGGGGGCKHMEILSLGATQGMDAARHAWAAMKGGGVVSAEQASDLEVGESVALTSERGAGAKLDGSGKGDGNSGSLSLGGETSRTSSASITRTEEGFDVDVSDRTKNEGSGTLGFSGGGGVGGSLGGSKTVSKGSGYVFSIPEDHPQRDALLDRIGAAQSDAQLAAIADEHPEIVKSRSEHRGDAHEVEAGVSLGGAKASVKSGASMTNDTTYDKDGNLVKETIVGANHAGGSIGIGDRTIGGSRAESATVQIDKDGNTTADIQRVEKQTSFTRFLAEHVPFASDPEEEAGLLESVLGREKGSTDDTTVTGMGARSRELQQLAHLAMHDPAGWMRACPRPSMREDWQAARLQIVRDGGTEEAVGRALAAFTGKRGNGRDDVIQSAIRQGDERRGVAYEFPEGLGHLKRDYDALIVADSHAPVAAAREAGDDAGAREKAQGLTDGLDRLYAALSSAVDKFDNRAIHAEMLSRINARKTEVRRAAGGSDADPVAIARDRYNDLLGVCMTAQHNENSLFARAEEVHGGRVGLNAQIELTKITNELRSLHRVWGRDYAQLAGLAQEHGFGADRYFKYQPDTPRLRALERGKPPGPATERTEETRRFEVKDEGKPGDATVAAPPRRDEIAESNAQLQANREAARPAREQAARAARAQAHGSGNRLFAAIQGGAGPGALNAHNEGMKWLRKADADFAKISPENTLDWETWGHVAAQDYRIATEHFQRGLLAG